MAEKNTINVSFKRMAQYGNILLLKYQFDTFLNISMVFTQITKSDCKVTTFFPYMQEFGQKKCTICQFFVKKLA